MVITGPTGGIGFYSAQEIVRLGSPAYRFFFGAIVLLYGGHFKTLTVIWSSLQNVSWNKVRVDFEEAMQMYHRSRTQLCEYAGGEGSVSAMAVEDVAQLGATVAAMNSRPLLEMFIRLQQSLIAQVACALNANTMQFTAGLDLSRRASSIIGSSVEACLLDKEDSGRDAVRKRAKLRLLTDGICMIVGVSGCGRRAQSVLGCASKRWVIGRATFPNPLSLCLLSLTTHRRFERCLCTKYGQAMIP